MRYVTRKGCKFLCILAKRLFSCTFTGTLAGLTDSHTYTVAWFYGYGLARYCPWTGKLSLTPVTYRYYYLHSKGEARYPELEKEVVKTRSVLSVSLQDLLKSKLVPCLYGFSRLNHPFYKLTREQG